MPRRFIPVFLVVLLLAQAVFATNYAVVTHTSNPTKSVTLAEFAKILKGKTTTWPNGRPITLVLPEPNSPEMNFILGRVLGAAAEDGKAFLLAQSKKPGALVIFVESDEMVLKVVEANPSAVGIVDVYSITNGVKVLKIEEKQPFDIGYILRGH